ncbi:hypothetical protein [Methylomonas sp. CM2]|uniref:hypothetical protein n=1 Tax=Methylomonas sp. CM2 TaxID=3417647 RepID=UPI003CF34611
MDRYSFHDSETYKISGEDFYLYVLEQERQGINALLSGDATARFRGSFVVINYKSGKIRETSPHIQYLVDRLTSSGLSVDKQEQILHGCNDEIAINYLRSLIEQDSLNNLIESNDDNNLMEF